MNKTKVAIQTLKPITNYGGILQAFALQFFLNLKGLEVIHLNRFNKPKSITLLFKLFIYKIINPNFYVASNKAKNVFRPFISKYINLTPPLTSYTEWKSYLQREQFDFVVVGSDQVWRMDYVRAFLDEFFLNFPKGNAKKIAYAASFGKHEIPKEAINVISNLLCDFDAISVRENEGVKFIRQNFNLEAQHLIDPTLLLNKNDYVKVFGLKKVDFDKNVFCYILDKTKYKLRIIKSVKNELNLKEKFVYGVEITKSNYRDKDIRTKITVESWLENFFNAAFIVTDSFHGMLFSIIFNKQFLVIANENRGVSRFKSMLELLNLENRLLFDTDTYDISIMNEKIDYQKVNTIIESEKEKSNIFFESLF